ncbi:trypsin-like peptidase domain-containing protein [Nocardia sp. NBC_00565]|uniref:S1C family serine protease n=1 Tax=Nocardia sp. NBC_00565 TaxID=2975993 RepID=UPI002E7FCD1B|nr:trypsin-like peptidase domain-containing protein [Nocardia sp. NBC_00565]WUC01000.1 trypsin-like peptidase domain-containing protein [Nocardia sp. NBC_00565]
MTEDSKDRRGEPANTDAAPGPHSTQEIPAVQPGQGYPQSGYVVHEQQPSRAPWSSWQQPNATQPFPGPEAGPEYTQPSYIPPVPPGGVPGAAFGAQPQPEPARRPIRTGLVVGAVALALVSGGVGGAVGSLVTRSDNGRAAVTNALDVPKPNVSNVANAPAGSTQAVAQKVLPSVVMIKVASNRAQGEGSGVVLSSDGLILTNNHVASGGGANATMEVAFSDGTTAPATLVGADPVSDLAVIKVQKAGLTPIELGTSANLAVGESVIAIGSPLGLAGTVTTGIVSALNRPVSTNGEGTPSQVQPVIDAVQTDAAINPGNSGGALVDANGKLIGINTAIASLGGGEATGQQSGSIGLGFAIPVDQARRVADELIKTGHATYAQIGIKLRPQDTAARVLEATPDGPAAKAGIPAGVVITKVDDRTIDSGDALIAAVRSHQPGDKVKITYTDEQGNNPKTVEVTLTGAPADGGR